jgi:predicted nucleic acid-binding protein
MILVDTSVLAAWLDPGHPNHSACTEALVGCAAADELAISVLTLAELAVGGRSREALDDDLRGFMRIAPDNHAAIQAGQTFGRYRPKKGRRGPSLAGLLIVSQAAALKVPLLTIEPWSLRAGREVDILVPFMKGRGAIG